MNFEEKKNIEHFPCHFGFDIDFMKIEKKEQRILFYMMTNIYFSAHSNANIILWYSRIWSKTQRRNRRTHIHVSRQQ